MSGELDEKDWYVPRKPNFTRDCCPQCYKPYERIGSELLPRCTCLTTGIHDNLCGRCGAQNCDRNH